MNFFEKKKENYSRFMVSSSSSFSSIYLYGDKGFISFYDFYSKIQHIFFSKKKELQKLFLRRNLIFSKKVLIHSELQPNWVFFSRKVDTILGKETVLPHVIQPFPRSYQIQNYTNWMYLSVSVNDFFQEYRNIHNFMAHQQLNPLLISHYC